MSELKNKIENIFEEIRNKELLNGTVLVAKDGNILYKGAFGEADITSKRPLTVNSVFNLASVSKPITAMAILSLVQEEKVNIDDSVKLWIPELPYEGVTIRHLLNHTSGLPDYLDLFEQHWNKSEIADNHNLLEYLITYTPECLFEPNQRVEYSNTGYILLAIIIERVTNLSFSEFLQNRFFTPLGMKNTKAIGIRRENVEIPDYAFGYVYDVYSGKHILADDFEESKMVTYLDGMLGDGGVQSTVYDLYLFEKALSSGELINKDLLKQAYRAPITEMETPFKYGFGWILEEDSDKGQIIWHSGGWPGYSTSLRRFIDKNIVIIILRNKEQDFNVDQQIASAIEQVVHGEEYELPSKYPTLERAKHYSTEILNKHVGSYALVEHPDLLIQVLLENDRLFIEMPGSMKLELYAKSEHNFFLRGLSIDVDFVRSGNDELLQVVDGSEVQSAKRV